MRHVILVDFVWTRAQDPRVPLGHASLLSALQARFRGRVHSILIPVNAGLVRPDEVAAHLLSHTRDLPPDRVDIALGAYVWGESLLQRVLPLLRDGGFRGRIILGGPQISYASGGLERLYPDADVFVRGYGEDALCALAEDCGRPALPGIHYAGEQDRALQAKVELDDLPSPLLDGTIPLLGQRFVRWETQRGCPFRCSFCQHREAGARLVRRNFADGRVWQEIDLLCAYAPDKIAVLDPIFNSSRRATEILARFVRNGFRGRLSLQCRAEYVDEAFLDAAEKLDVCLEFGLQTIHHAEGRAVHRQNKLSLVSEVLSQVRRRHIDHEVSLIFGLPEQTLASFQESVRWCLERRVPVIKAFPLMLLRGTELDRDRQRWGLVEDGSDMPCVVASNTFGHADWLAMGRISEALRLTEGRHPDSIEQLLALTGDAPPSLSLWQPSPAPTSPHRTEGDAR